MFDAIEAALDDTYSIDDSIPTHTPPPTTVTPPRTTNSAPTKRRKAPRKKKTASEFTADLNILDERVLADLVDTVIFEDDGVFSTVKCTTITMGGNLKNVKFTEEKLIQLIEPTDIIPRLLCNFGDVRHPTYVPFTKKPASTRGRKIKQTNKPPRKKQGTGECFSSQMTFFVLRGSFRGKTREYIEAAAKREEDPYYQIKIFRNGKVQLPGGKPELAADVIRCVRDAIVLLDDVLRVYRVVFADDFIDALCSDIATLDNHSSGATPDDAPVEFAYLSTDMNNYKFYVHLQKKHKINLVELKAILTDELGIAIQSTHITPTDISLFSVGYNRQRTVNLSIIFATPNKRNLDKQVLVSIYRSGKINILGGLYSYDVRDIFNYLYRTITDNIKTLAVTEGLGANSPIVPVFNIAMPVLSDDEIMDRYDVYTHRINILCGMW